MCGAVNADGVEVHGPIFLIRSRFSDEIRLRGARIQGDLKCSGAKLEVKVKNGAEEITALFVDGAEIDGNVFLDAFKDERFTSTGVIRLVGTRITGVLDCSGAKLGVKEENALSADGAEIGGSVFLSKGFESTGAIRLLGAKICGELDFCGASVTGVSCENLRLTGNLLWIGIRTTEKTELHLTGVRLKNLHEDRESWPEAGKLVLDGLVYEDVTLRERPPEKESNNLTLPKELELKVEERIEWLMLQPEKVREKPQPWMQLRDLLERKGDRKGAKYVLFRFRCLQAQKSWIPWRWLRKGFARLEEKPLRILYTISLAVLLGWLVFGYAGTNRALAPTEAEAYKTFAANQPLPGTYPVLNSFVYTLENAVPLVRLGQDDKWAPDKRYPGTSWFTNYWFLMWSRWMLILFGWVQATVLAAALSGRFKP